MPTLRRDPDGTWTVIEDSPRQFNPVSLAVVAGVAIVTGVGILGFKALTGFQPKQANSPAVVRPIRTKRQPAPSKTKPAPAKNKAKPKPAGAVPKPKAQAQANSNKPVPVPLALRSTETPVPDPGPHTDPPKVPAPRTREPETRPTKAKTVTKRPGKSRPPVLKQVQPPNGTKATTFVPPRSDYIPPVYGQVRLGAFAGEAAHLAGITYISTVGLSDPGKYAAYRDSVHNTYGVDLEDMNYFSLNSDRLDSRLRSLQAWLLMAGRYGDVTVALEPPYDTKFDVFHDAGTMAKLAAVFQNAKDAGITVWIRFASESNLHGSKYSVTENPYIYHDAAAEFKAQMPDNVRLVFSPLINTFVQGRAAQRPLAAEMYLGKNGKIVWDRIGGTIYRTDQPLEPTYRAYYDFMSQIDPETPFQICEVGGPYSKRDETLQFLKSCSEGGFPRLVKVNLFARDINRRADPNAEFGFLEPAEKNRGFERALASKRPSLADSFLKPVLAAARKG